MYRIFSYIILIISLICFAIIIIYPNQFQKFNSTKVAKHQAKFSPDKNISFRATDFLNSIPYSNSPDYVFSVKPATKYANTILHGNGDCSTMSFGAAYYFIDHDLEFELIHFLPEKSLFRGGGHVAIRMPYLYKNNLSIGILDIAGGGVVAEGWEDFDVNAFLRNSSPFNFIKINALAPKFYENYYTRKYLSDVHLGYTPKEDIIRYFRFIEKVYIPLYNEKLEKYIFDGLAMVSNNYYNIYVGDQFAALFNHEIMFFTSLLFLIRLLICLVPVFIVMIIIRYYNKHKEFQIEHSPSSI